MVRKSWLVLVVFLVSFSSHAAVSFADVEKAYQDFYTYMTGAAIDPAVANRKADAIKDLSDQLIADATALATDKEKALGYVLTGYRTASWVDRAVNYPKFIEAVRVIKASFPGCRMAGVGEGYILEDDMPKLTPTEFIDRVKYMAKTYPADDGTQYTVRTYCERLKETDISGARLVVDEAIKVYPGNKRLPIVKNALYIKGTDADLNGTLLDGKAFDVKDWKGKVVVVDFWASWCYTCTYILPDLQAIRVKHKDVAFLGVNIDTDFAAAEKHALDHKMDWPNLFFKTLKDKQDVTFRHGVLAIPAVFVIGKDGKHARYSSYDVKKIEKTVEEELAK